MTGRSIRQKGLQFERDVANSLHQVFPEARRNLEDARENRKIDLAGTEGWAIQCKRGRGYASPSVISEILPYKPDDIPCLVSRADNKEAMVTLRFTDFLGILRRLYDIH